MQLASADLITLTTLGGTIYRWTSFDVALVVSGNTFTPGAPWVQRSRWNVANDMQVPTLELYVDSNAAVFANGLGLKALVIAGFFDGSTVLLQRVYMPFQSVNTSTYGTIDIFAGDVGAVSMGSIRATFKIRGKASRLGVMVPRNIYQPGCLHSFCDPGCTLSKATFTNTYTVTSGSTRTVVNASTFSVLLKGGTLTMTSGAAAGEVRSIINATAGGVVTLSNPLTVAPLAGDTYSGFKGCAKTMAMCTTYSNFINFRGFPYIPPPATTAVGQ